MSKRTRVAVIAVCRRCAREKKHQARGMCSTCYVATRQAVIDGSATWEAPPPFANGLPGTIGSAPKAKPARVRIKKPEPGEGLEKPEAKAPAASLRDMGDEVEVLISIAELEPAARNRVIAEAMSRWMQ